MEKYFYLPSKRAEGFLKPAKLIDEPEKTSCAVGYLVALSDERRASLTNAIFTTFATYRNEKMPYDSNLDIQKAQAIRESVANFPQTDEIVSFIPFFETEDHVLPVREMLAALKNAEKGFGSANYNPMNLVAVGTQDGLYMYSYYEKDDSWEEAKIISEDPTITQSPHRIEKADRLKELLDTRADMFVSNLYKI
jgi:hypothetical protein